MSVVAVFRVFVVSVLSVVVSVPVSDASVT